MAFTLCGWWGDTPPPLHSCTGSTSLLRGSSLHVDDGVCAPASASYSPPFAGMPSSGSSALCVWCSSGHVVAALLAVLYQQLLGGSLVVGALLGMDSPSYGLSLGLDSPCGISFIWHYTRGLSSVWTLLRYGFSLWEFLHLILYSWTLLSVDSP